MILNIYEKKKAVKTYTADRYDLEFGVLEDLAAAVKLDDLKSDNEIEMFRMAMNLITNSMDTVRELMKDIFEGLTDEEMHHTRVSEIAAVIVDVMRLTIEQLGRGLKSKN